MEIPQLQCIDEAIDDPVVQVSRVQVMERTVGIPQLRIVEKTADSLQTHTIQGTQTSESLGSAPVCQVAQAEVGEVHLTGVVKPDDLDAKIKFLAEEALHGVGGFVFDAHGNSVANELGGRNCVTGEMWKSKLPFSLALNNAISDDIAWQCITLDVEAGSSTSWYSCRRYGGARLEDAGFE